jgi:hypothetical protein
MTRQIAIDLLRTHIAEQNQPAEIIRGGYGARLDKTRQLIDALRPVAEQELVGQGYDVELVGNPLERLLNPGAQPPLFAKLRSAINLGARATAFDPRPAATPETPPIPWGIGMRARLSTNHTELRPLGLEIHAGHIFELLDNRTDLTPFNWRGRCEECGTTWNLRNQDLRPLEGVVPPTATTYPWRVGMRGILNAQARDVHIDVACIGHEVEITRINERENEDWRFSARCDNPAHARPRNWSLGARMLDPIVTTPEIRGAFIDPDILRAGLGGLDRIPIDQRVRILDLDEEGCDFIDQIGWVKADFTEDGDASPFGVIFDPDTEDEEAERHWYTREQLEPVE